MATMQGPGMRHSEPYRRRRRIDDTAWNDAAAGHSVDTFEVLGTGATGLMVESGNSIVVRFVEDEKAERMPLQPLVEYGWQIAEIVKSAVDEENPTGIFIFG